MILGLKRRISRFLQYAKLKLTEKPNFQEIQLCPEGGISPCPVKKKKPSNGRGLQFRSDILKHTSLNIDFLQSVASNSEVSKSSDNNISCHEAPNILAKAVLTDIYEQAENYGKNQAIKINQYFNGRSFIDIPKNENVVVEFRNEAIANPFHVSHLRTIMIGRFITNISKLFNKNVTFVNYLEDWTNMMRNMIYKRHGYLSTQEYDDLFHLIGLVDKFEEIPRIHTYNEVIYEIFKQTVAFMKSLEKGDQKALEIWQKCKDIYVNDHEQMYQRLGIKFDATYAESQYIEKTNQIMSMAKEKNLLLDVKGEQLIDVGSWKPSYIGSSDSILRVIAAAFDRFNIYSADRIIYLADMDKSDFKIIQRITKKLRDDQPGRIEYARTGEVEQLSTTSPSLSNMLGEFMNSKTAIILKHKLWEDNESLCDVSDKLSICQFAMKNLKQRRYNKFFGRNLHKSFGGHETPALQHSHVRLCRLIKLCNDDYSFKSIDFSLLSEKCAIRLIQHLARYHEVLIESYMELQSHHLVCYLATLMKLEHLAYKELLVFNQPKEIRDARLTLFICTRQVLANGMNILGIQPLGKI